MNRIEKVQMMMSRRSIDQIIVSDLTSIKYLTGCSVPLTQFLSVLLINQTGKPILINFIASLGKITDQVIHARYLQTQDSVEFLSKHINSNGLLAIDKKFGIGYLERLKSFSHFRYIVDDVVDSVRLIKEEEEQELLRKSSQICDQVMGEIRQKLVVGVQESDIYSFMKKRVVELGAEGLSFEPTVSFGPNTGIYKEKTRSLEKGDCVIIDFGCKYQGYCSDMTRYFAFKENKLALDLYKITRAAQEAAYAVIKPGVAIKEAAIAARKVIEASGYGNNNFYPLGHGVGLGIHELFYVSLINEDCFQEGMCFSVEPGIYIPKVIGCRVEDLVIVTKDGVEILNKYDKDNIFLD